MTSAAELGLGATFAVLGTNLDEVTDLGDFGVTRTDIDVTSHDSSGNAEEFIAGLRNALEITVVCNLVSGDTNGQMKMITLCESATANHAPFKITLPNTAASTFEFTGYVKSYKIKPDLKGQQKITFVVKQDRGAGVWTV